MNLKESIVLGAESVAGWGGNEKNGRRSSSSQPGMDGIKCMPHEQGRAKSCYIL